MRVLWPVVVAGCAWISPREHAANQALLDGGADADTDTDADADADADADTDTGPSECVELDVEENDTVLTATDVTAFPSTFVGTLCPDDATPELPVPADLYRVDVLDNDVLVATLGSGDLTSCDEQDLLLDIVDEGLNVLAAGRGNCPALQSGYGAGRYYVRVQGDAALPQQDYRLVLDTRACADIDDDGWLASVCGGPDCNDFDPDANPGTSDTPGDAVDQDCDGGDDLPSSCFLFTGASLQPADDTLPCGDLTTGAVWDRWTVPDVGVGESVSIVVQNGAGAADPLALLVDASGTAHYGLESDRSQLDDGEGCDVVAWTGQITACPGACVEPTAAGDATLWVAQWPGAGCTEGAEYKLIVYVGGEELIPTPVGDDEVLAFP